MEDDFLFLFTKTNEMDPITLDNFISEDLEMFLSHISRCSSVTS